MIPTSIDGTDITGATIDGTDVTEITVDGDTVFSAGPSFDLPVAYSNLVAWYPFDSVEYGGSNADDVTAIGGGSGNDTAYDGTVNGASYQSSGGVTDINAGANSGAFDFSGSASDDIDLPLTTINDNNSSGMTITAWADVTTTGPQQYIVSGTKTGNADGGLFMIIDSGNFEFQPQGDRIQSAPVSTGLQHFAGAVDSSGASWYIDGSLVATRSAFTVTAPNECNIGNTQSTRNFEGTIDDVRFYNTKLSGSQINSIYDNTKP